MGQPVTGRYYDGLSSKRHQVNIAYNSDMTALILTAEAFTGRVMFPLQDLRALADHASRDSLTVTLHHEGSDDESTHHAARLILHDTQLIARLQDICPNLNMRDIKAGTWSKVIKRSVFAVGAVVIALFVILPNMANTLAKIIPIEREIAFGKVISAQIEFLLGGSEIGALHCKSPEGMAALDQMVARLSNDRGLHYDLDVKVFDHEMVNAFAMPGGQIVIMRGLLEQASGPDEVAAVLAHEIGHVERRDPTRHALRAAGSAGILSMALGDFSGGTLAVILGEQILQSSYSREAEAEADLFALSMLNAANVDSTGMANFFDSIQDIEAELPELPAYFSSHPASSDRANRARKNAEAQLTTSPTLDMAGWQYLGAICD